jgi:PAS domain S-box-containing protein
MTEPIDRILVVDDHDVKRYTVAHTLRRAGFDVAEGSSGAEALRGALEAALVVLDVKLPDMDGFEVCGRLKADPVTAHIPILLLSATFVGPDSQVRGLDSGADAYLTDASEPPVLVATARALIRMRRAEEQARRGEARLRVALEAGRLGEWDLDLETGELTGSAPFRAIFGWPPAVRFTLADLDAVAHPDDRAAVRAARSRAAEGGPYDAEYRVVWPSGEVRWVLVRGQVVTGIAHRHLIGVALDVTEQKRSEESLKEADRRKDEFLAMLAHELRNPLAPLRNALEIAQAPGADPGAVARARATMGRQLGNMVRLIDDLLDVSRINKGKIELRYGRVELAAVVAAALETSRPLIEAGRHELTTDLPAEPVWLNADPTRLAQVVANLLNNAAKYTPDGGRIRLSAALVPAPPGRDPMVNGTDTAPFPELHSGPRVSPPVQVEIRVADNGVGIPPEVLPLMWEMFAQADRTVSRSKGGLGIGLTLVKRLVELHGGSVAAFSAGPNQGSEFTVRLPVAQHDGITTTPPPPAQPPVARRILVVDDNSDGLESLATLLGIAGHQVRIAADGPSALVAASEFGPDVVLLDIGLPGMDGYEVARRLRAQPAFRSTRLIALTGWGQDADRERSRRRVRRSPRQARRPRRTPARFGIDAGAGSE